jgi:hypothetical protein
VAKRRRARHRARAPDGDLKPSGARLKAPTSDYANAQGSVLTLRGSLTAGSRAEYERALAGSPLSREDAWQRAVELLFERLAVRWEIADAPIERQRELLLRFRAASPQERAWVREVLREHCAENFPDIRAP